MDSYLIFILPIAGLAAGTIGALIGAGGGFIIVSLLLYVFPDDSPGLITTVSQSVVLLTSLSATTIYVREKRVNYRSSLNIAAGGVIGMALGAFTVEHLSRGYFQIICGVALFTLMLYLLINPVRKQGEARNTALSNKTISQKFWLFILGLSTGFMGGLLGIGGGIFIVPSLVQLFAFPAHIATATSQFVILITSPAAIAVHATSVPISDYLLRILLLGVGAIIGAQVGARISKYFSAPWLIRSLALTVGFVGIQLLNRGFNSI